MVYPENMLRNMNRFRGLIHSQRVLLALTQKGVSREAAYAIVQRNAMKVWEQGADFMAELKADPEVRAALERGRDRGELRSRLSHPAGGHDLPPGVRGSVRMPRVCITGGGTRDVDAHGGTLKD